MDSKPLKIIRLIPGAGRNFTCENCLRDHVLTDALQAMGHEVLVVPLYLPLRSATKEKSGIPIFFGGINVFLQQYISIFRKTPRWVDALFDSLPMLDFAGRLSGMTSATDLAKTTLSMLKGEDGNQAKELERLIQWLKAETQPDVIHLSNGLLLGMARRLKQELNVPIVCTLQDEDIFIDPLPEPYRTKVWDLFSQRAKDVDAFVPVSRYYEDHMTAKLHVSTDRMWMIYNGLPVENYQTSDKTPEPPTIGYIERLCHDKGLHLLVEAFISIKQKGNVLDLRLHIAGGHTAEDEEYIGDIKKSLEEAGYIKDVTFAPDPMPWEKPQLLHSYTLFSVPAVHREAFGLSPMEAMAAGIPVVQPDSGAFPELIELTGGGILFEHENVDSLSQNLEALLLDSNKRIFLGNRGRQEVQKHFDIKMTASRFNDMIQSLLS